MYSSSPVARLLLIVAMVVGATILSAQPALAQPGWVLSHQKISSTQGGFRGTGERRVGAAGRATPVSEPTLPRCTDINFNS